MRAPLQQTKLRFSCFIAITITEMRSAPLLIRKIPESHTLPLLFAPAWCFRASLIQTYINSPLGVKLSPSMPNRPHIMVTFNWRIPFSYVAWLFMYISYNNNQNISGGIKKSKKAKASKRNTHTCFFCKYYACFDI